MLSLSRFIDINHNNLEDDDVVIRLGDNPRRYIFKNFKTSMGFKVTIICLEARKYIYQSKRISRICKTYLREL